MTPPAHDRPTAQDRPADGALLDAARAGDAGALEALRHRYRGTAVTVAGTRAVRGEDPGRIADAALDRIEEALRDGGGPHGFLGAFVVWMVAREASGGTSPVALPDDPADPRSVVRSFTALPGPWQAALWEAEVLGRPEDVPAGLLREASAGLRGAYRDAAGVVEAAPDCEDVAGDLPDFAASTLPAGRAQQVRRHLGDCARCTAQHLQATDAGTGMREWLLPVLAGLPPWGARARGLAAALRSTTTGPAAAAGAAAGAGTAAAGVAAATTPAAADAAAEASAAAAPAAVPAGTGAGAGTGAADGARTTGTPAHGAGRTTGAGHAAEGTGRRRRVLVAAGALAAVVAVGGAGLAALGDPDQDGGAPVSAARAPQTGDGTEQDDAGPDDAEQDDAGRDGDAHDDEQAEDRAGGDGEDHPGGGAAEDGTGADAGADGAATGGGTVPAAGASGGRDGDDGGDSTAVAAGAAAVAGGGAAGAAQGGAGTRGAAPATGGGQGAGVQDAGAAAGGDRASGNGAAGSASGADRGGSAGSSRGGSADGSQGGTTGDVQGGAAGGAGPETTPVPTPTPSASPRPVPSVPMVPTTPPAPAPAPAPVPGAGADESDGRVQQPRHERRGQHGAGRGGDQVRSEGRRGGKQDDRRGRGAHHEGGRGAPWEPHRR